MRDDLPAAAVRLLASQSVRTHERKVFVHVVGSHATKKIMVDGKTYISRRALKEALHVGNAKIDDWLARGRARFI